MKSLEQRLKYADAVFWFEFPPYRCIFNILKREFRYRGKARPDMPESCISKIDFEFLKYAWNFNRKYKDRIEELLQEKCDIKVFHFKKHKEVNEFLKNHRDTTI